MGTNASKNASKNVTMKNASKNASKNVSKNAMPSNNTLKNKNNAPHVGGNVATVGSRSQVMHGTAHRTSGGLCKNDLMYNKNGRIVSRKASRAGKKALSHLVKAGYKAKKGTFKLFRSRR